VKTLLLFTSFLLIFKFGSAQNCPQNIDFEQGDFANWQCFIGTTYVDANNNNVISLTPSAPTPNRHEIITRNSTLLDKYGNFPSLCPYGGDYSVKLGNDAVGSEAEGISYTFTIPPNADTFSLTYFYAVVLQDPQHSIFEQPRFFVTAYDVLTGNLINCASYNYVSTSSLPGFKISTLDPSVLYKEWAPASIDFSGLAGRSVRLEFKTADCTKGAHFGYAYLDVGTGCGGLITVATQCVGNNSVILNSPYGFQNYTWYNANYSTVVGNTQNVTISPAPPANTMFHVDLVPYPSFGCRDTADAKVVVEPLPLQPTVTTPYSYCQYQSSLPLAGAPNPGNFLLWYTSPSGGAGSIIPPVPPTGTAGTQYFYASQKSLTGCESLLRSVVTVNTFPTPASSFLLNKARQCLMNNNFIFSNTSTSLLNGASYKWFFGDGDSSELKSPSHVYKTPGNFTVKLICFNPNSCQSEKSLNVVVVDLPVSKFSTGPSLLCEAQTPLVLTDNSVTANSSINKWWWSAGGNIYSTKDVNSVLTTAPAFTVKHVVTTAEGCVSDTTEITLPVHSKPKPAFKAAGLLCNNEVITLNDASTLAGGVTQDKIVKWNWVIDNSPAIVVQNPSVILPAGIRAIQFEVESNVGCKATINNSININPNPELVLTINDSCINRDIIYTVTNLPGTNMRQYLWNFGSGVSYFFGVVKKRYTTNQTQNLTIYGVTDKGCRDTIIRPFYIYKNFAYTDSEILASIGQPVQLDAHGGSSNSTYLWSPALGLDNITIEKPIATLATDQLYHLESLTKEGCDAHSDVLVKRFKGPEIYVPNAFSPNKDGVNDVLRVFPAGALSFFNFSVYNRIGELVFTTSDYRIGWDGNYKGKPAEVGTYVYYVKAKDYKGNPMFKKGSVILIR
jgi:gliding motility-associated-like protein